MKAFIPGGAGYIGSILTGELLKQGFSVHVIDRLIFKQSSLLSYIGNKSFKFTYGDLRDESLMKQALKSADVVIPLAALVGAPLCDKYPGLAKKINLEAPRRLFSLISKSQQILMPTTNSAYGSGAGSSYCDETSALNPISIYSQHKVELEQTLMSLPNAISFRLATVFGISPRMRLDLLVNDFTYRAIRDSRISLFEGHFKRNYIHIKDVARVFIHAIEHFDKMKGEIFNVGLSDANLSKLELCERIKSFVPLEVTEDHSSKDPDQRNYIVSNEKIERTGFRPLFKLDDGIREIVEAFELLNDQMHNLGHDLSGL